MPGIEMTAPLRREASGRWPWEWHIFYAFFLLDSFRWIGVMQGMDFRASYVVLGLGLLLMLISRPLLLPREFLLLFSGVTLVSLLASGMRGDILVGVVLQLVGVFPFMLLAYCVAKSMCLQEAARHYLTASRFVAISILLQQIVFFIAGREIADFIFAPLGGINPGYVQANGLLRASGLLYEPSQVGLLLPPALYLALKLRDKRSARLIFLGVILSFSSLAYIGMLTVILFANFSFRQALKALPLILIVLGAVYLSPVATDKVSKLSGILVTSSSEGLGSEDIKEARASVGSSIANFLVASRGLEDSPWIGHGLGSFKVLFPEYIEEVLPGVEELDILVPGQGKSLLIRLTFEYGLVGLSLVIVFFWARWSAVYKSRRAIPDGDIKFYWANAVIIFFVVYMVRKETYVSFYIWFFLSLFLLATCNGGKRTGYSSGALLSRETA